MNDAIKSATGASTGFMHYIPLESRGIAGAQVAQEQIYNMNAGRAGIRLNMAVEPPSSPD